MSHDFHPFMDWRFFHNHLRTKEKGKFHAFLEFALKIRPDPRIRRGMYLDFFGVSKKPFENTPDTDFLYPSPTHREALASFVYGIKEGKGFMMVAGDVGSGKTLLINALLAELGEEHIVVHIVNPTIGFEILFDYICSKAGISRQQYPNILEASDALKVRLLELNHAGRRLVLIVDEAHLLSDRALEEVRLLSNIEGKNVKLVQIILAGQTELSDKINRPELRQLKQRIVLSRSLTGLSQEETGEYIRHRLKIAGMPEGPAGELFDSSVVEAIHRASGGVPRVINHICDNTLLTAYAEGAKQVTPRMVKEVLADMESKSERILPASTTGITVLDEVSYRTSFLRKWLPDRVKQVSILDLAGRAALIIGGLILLFGAIGAITSSSRKQQQETPPVAAAPASIQETKAATPTPTPAPAAPPESAPIPPSVEAPAAKPEPMGTMLKFSTEHGRKITVSDMQTLSQIALQYYGMANATMLDILAAANPTIDNIDIVQAGQELMLPSLKAQELVAQDASGRYLVYYAAFRSPGMAEQYVENLKNEGHPSIITLMKIRGSLFHRLFLGPFDTKEQAEQAATSMNFPFIPLNALAP